MRKEKSRGIYNKCHLLKALSNARVSASVSAQLCYTSA